jgi:ketosteroid isomerase-like protein
MSQIFSGSRLAIVQHFLAAASSDNADEAISFYNEDAQYRFGNSPPVIGRQAILESANTTHLDQIKDIAFDVKAMWEQGDVIICEMEITYTRRDGKVFTLPCCDTIRMKGNKFQDLRVYMDASPLFTLSPTKQQDVARKIPLKQKRETPEKFPGFLTSIVKEMFMAAESNNVDEYVSFFTEDALFKVGNLPSVFGPQGIRDFESPVRQVIRTVSHEVKEMWEQEDVVICEMEITYTRRDGKVLILPCVDVIQMERDKVWKMQAYLDPSPVFA